MIALLDRDGQRVGAFFKLIKAKAIHEDRDAVSGGHGEVDALGAIKDKVGAAKLAALIGASAPRV